MFSNALMAGKNIEGSCVTKHAIFLDSSSRIAKKSNIPLLFYDNFEHRHSTELYYTPLEPPILLYRKIASKIKCIFEKYIVRGTFWHKYRNCIFSCF